MSPKPAFISFDRPASHPASPEGLVLFDFAPGQVWKNATGTFIVGIQEKTPSGRFVIYTKDTDVIEAHQQPLDTEALIGFIREKECLVKSEASLPAKKTPKAKPVSEPAPSKVVANMNEAREQRGMEPVPVKLEQQNALFSEIEELDYEIAPALESINSKMKAIWAVLEEVKEDATVETIRTRAVEASQRASDLSAEDDAADDEQKGKAFTREYVDAKRKRLEELQNIFVQLVALSSDIEVQEAVVVEAGAPVEVTMTAGGKSDAVVPGSGEGAPADKKPRASRKGKGGGTGDGGDGTGDDEAVEKPQASKPKRGKKPLSDIVPEPSVMPMGLKEAPKESEDSEKFDAILKASWEEVAGLIHDITTLDGYIKFRQGMVTISSGETDRSPRRYIFSLKKIRESLGRALSTEEIQHIGNLEEEMGKMARKKFFELKNTDLRSVSKRWEQERDEVKDEVTLDALAEAWSRESAVPASWTAVFDVLSESERGIIRTDFTARFAEFKKDLEEKQEAFKLDKDTSWRQELDAFQGRFERAVHVYRGMISGERTRFLEATFPFKDLTDKTRWEIWEKELLPKIRGGILADIVSRGNLDQKKAEEVLSGLLREIEMERIKRMETERMKRSAARSKKQTK